MNKKVIFFDLDGTLLPMNQDLFLKLYFGSISNKLSKYGYDHKKLVNAIMEGTKAMFLNNGTDTNENVFWKVFESIYGVGSRKDEPLFEEYYHTDFISAKEGCGYNKYAGKVISKLKEKGYKLVLATNPIFPKVATLQRIKWAGLNEDDFEIITTYENSSFCKPNLNYYLELCERLNVNPSDCMMVGNDVNEDMITTELGMDVFLIETDLLNRDNKDISVYNKGSLLDLIHYIENNF